MTLKTKLLAATLILSASITLNAQSNYPNNRPPLVQKPYMELPLGSIKAKGWLYEMLDRQRKGATGQMDTLYPQVMGARNGWLGGDGDQWERGPYWIDGLLPLAYILDDQKLKDKAKPWVEWMLQSQREDGYFGPAKNYSYEPGLQRDNAEDWWPRMVALKILQQYYSATGDKRVITLMSNYFKYQLKTLPEKPLGHWSFWANYRQCDNQQAVYWLYNITGETFLLELGDLLHKQGHDFVHMFLNTNDLTRTSSIHCVNLAQGMKEPVIYYQRESDPKYIFAVKKGFSDLKQYNGQAQGMYGGDEGLHGNNPTQGSELCSAVELMFSLEKMIEITGDLDFVDHLEKITFNALPTQISDDFMTKQYFQQANQVMVTRYRRNFDQEDNHDGTDVLFGTLTGFPCCYSNMHQGWPKFTQSLWYATPDNGIAALAYSPSEVTARVGQGYTVKITEDTYYPMDEKIQFTVQIPDSSIKEVEFPLHLRVPSWTRQATLAINGKPELSLDPGKVIVVKRTWKNNDTVTLSLPMPIKTNEWQEYAISIERGPLVYALKMEENWKQKEFSDRHFGKNYFEVTSPSKWNYGIIESAKQNPNERCRVIVDAKKQKSTYPWTLKDAPIEIKVKAKTIPTWQLYGEMSGPLPYSVSNAGSGQEEEITLIPYGCTTLRISEFPVVR